MQKVNYIFVDFDGTILDNSDWHYEVYRRILKKNSCKFLSKEIYWRLKRGKISNAIILGKTNAGFLAGRYDQSFKDNIEDDERLKYDRLFKGAYKTLKKLIAKDITLYLLSCRQRKDLLFRQLALFRIKGFFKNVLVTASSNNPYKGKQYLIRKLNISFSNNNIIMVGDTEIDVRLGHRSGCITTAVLSGIRNRDQLINAKPDFLLKDINSLPKIIENRL